MQEILVPYQYAYFVVTLFFFIPWGVLFVMRKDIRKEMLVMSVIVGLGLVVTQYIWWTIDWWRPETIFGTRVGIEDFLLGFSNGGIVAVLYGVVTKRRMQRIQNPHGNHIVHALLVVAAGFSLMALSFWNLKIHSFPTSLLGATFIFVSMMLLRRDLLRNALMSGLFFVLLVFPFYFLSEFLSPGIIQHTWLFDNLSGLSQRLRFPIEDLVWYFGFGIIFGPLYEFFTQTRLQKSRTQ